MVVFDDDLSPSQNQNLERKLTVIVLDRSLLILDIFAKHAQTAQARTQVELAQLQYLLPRLRGLWTHLERQQGGIGTRGPGEQAIETDRRIVRDRIKKLRDRLDKIELQGKTRRKNRGQYRSEEHTSELQSRGHLVCRLLLEKKKDIDQKRVPSQDIADVTN